MPTPHKGDDFGNPLLQVPDYQWQDMRHYVRDCADRLGLRDWTAHFAREKPEELNGHDCEAAIDVGQRRRHFTIWLPLDWFKKAGGTQEEREEARTTVAHELLHVTTRRLRRMPQALQTNVGDHVWGTWWDIYEDELEIMVDDLAEIVSPILPLPDMPQKANAKKIAKK